MWRWSVKEAIYCIKMCGTRGGRMSGVSVSHFGISRVSNLVCSKLDRLKPMTFKLILVDPSQIRGIIRIGQGLVGSATG